jgi:hypothetical protein
VAFAKASDTFDVLVLLGFMGQGRDRLRREKAAERFRMTVACAGIRVRVSGGYLQEVGGRPGIDEEAEEHEQRNRRSLRKWSRLLGADTFNLMLDILHLGQPIPEARIPSVACALLKLAVHLGIDE